MDIIFPEDISRAALALMHENPYAEHDVVSRAYAIGFCAGVTALCTFFGADPPIEVVEIGPAQLVKRSPAELGRSLQTRP